VEDGPPGPIPWLRPYPRPQNMFPDRKIRSVMQILPSHAGMMPVTEKNPDYYWLSSQVFLHPKLGS